MKRKIFILIIVGFSWGGILDAQKVLTLKECYEGAYAANALAREKEMQKRLWELKDRNLSKSWLPALDANGSFLYNSSVVDMTDVLGSLPLPGISDLIKPLPHEQYKITVDINQVIYDGGAVKSARAVEKAELRVSQKQTDSDLYKLRSQINTYYFNILNLERQEELLRNYLDLIKSRISAMQSGVNSGVILRTDIDVMDSERIKLEQQLAANSIRKTSLLRILSDLTGIETSPSTVLVPPSIPDELTMELERSELALFDLRKEQLTAGLKAIDSKRMPKAFGFATIGYGNPPGSNFFRDEFAAFYILGAGVRWNIFDWNKAGNEKQMIMLQQNILENRKTDLEDNLGRLLEAKKSEIAGIKTLLDSDPGLIAARKRITGTAASRYDNGAITATEYMNEMNAEKEAMINHEMHKIALILAKIEYFNLSGKEIE